MVKVTTDNMEKRLYKVSSYARMMGVTDACVRKWIRQGKIKFEKIDGVTFVKEEKNGKQKND